MSLFDEIVAVYSELTNKDFHPISGLIALKDDGDGIAYIAKWDYDHPIPEGLSLGKPTA
jgi:hypothetical protein